MNLKSWFVKDVPDEKETDEEQQEVQEPVKKSYGGTKTNVTTFVAGAGVTVSNTIPSHSSTNYNEVFDRVIQETKQESPGYKEFSKVLSKMEGRPFTDSQKYENTFMSFEAMGVTSDKLVRTAQELVINIKNQQPYFDEEIQTARNQNVIAKEQEAERLTKENEELTKRVQENAAKIKQFTNEAIQSSQELDAETAAFQNTLNTRVAIIEEHIKNIKNYLPNGTTTTV